MSDPENKDAGFLQRWSRRKQTAGARPRAAGEQARSANAEARPLTDAASQGKAAVPAFDPASLPTIDSITATTDIRAFLAPGVPEELARAALRRAWTSDPAIRDFVGLAENQWDFTRPDTVPGFGVLQLTPELRRILAEIVGGPREQMPSNHEGNANAGAREKLTAPAAPVSIGAVSPDTSDAPQMQRLGDNDAAVQPKCAETDAGGPPRRHGGALPK